MNSYLSKENLNNLFRYISQDVSSANDINLSDNSKYRKALKK